MQPGQPFFYEKVTEGLSVPATGKVAISLLLGLLFFLLHYGSVGAAIFQDFSWFLSILIATAMLTLYYATHTLMSLMPEIHRLGADPEKFTHKLQAILTNRNFIATGFFFGGLNCLFGYWFGLPYDRGLEILTILFGYFLAGFVCGMAVLGIIGSVVSLSTISRESRLSF